MAAYNFQKRFVQAITMGVKRSTIRARRANGYLPKPGERIRLYTGMRTRGCKLIEEVTVERVRPVKIMQDERVEVIIDAERLSRLELLELVKREGFPGVYEFGAFFMQKHGPEFNGYLIEWRV